MISTSFDESNCAAIAPEGQSSEQIEALSIWRGIDVRTGWPVCISCWKLTIDELEEFKRTGRIWLTCLGEAMPPVRVEAIKPEMQS